MFTTTRVSVGIAFGPVVTCGLGSAVATAFVASGEGAGVALVVVGCVDELEFRLLGSTVQPIRNTDKRKMDTKSRESSIFVTPPDNVEQWPFLGFLVEQSVVFRPGLHD
jgi:hypothetical protein